MELLLPDETVKMILSAQGHMKDVSKEMEAFLQYLITHKAASDLTARIENAVETARQHKRWRGEYMTLYEKYRKRITLCVLTDFRYEFNFKKGLPFL